MILLRNWGHKKLFKPSSGFLLAVPGLFFFCGSFLLVLFHFCLYCTVMSVHCSLVTTCLERARHFAFLYVMVPCVFVTFLYDISGQVWYLIVSIPDLCLLLYLVYIREKSTRYHSPWESLMLANQKLRIMLLYDLLKTHHEPARGKNRFPKALVACAHGPVICQLYPVSMF